MRTFYIFNINDDIAYLMRNDQYPLFMSLNKIKNMKKSDLSLGVNIYEQIASPLDKSTISKKLYDYYRESDFYSIYQNNHSYINKYRDEKSFLYVKNTYLKLISNKENPEFFKCLKKNKKLFICDFDNKDYFYLNNI